MLRRKVTACAFVLGFLLYPAGLVLAQQGHVVETQDNVFSPADITISLGDSIEFRNTGRLPHTATAEDNSFDTGNLNPGQSRRVTFSRAGTIEYVCTYHVAIGMVGTIVVNPSSAGGASPTPSPSPSPAASPAPEAPTAPTESPAPRAVASPGRAEYTPLIFGVVGLVAAAGLAVSGLVGERQKR